MMKAVLYGMLVCMISCASVMFVTADECGTGVFSAACNELLVMQMRIDESKKLLLAQIDEFQKFRLTDSSARSEDISKLNTTLVNLLEGELATVTEELLKHLRNQSLALSARLDLLNKQFTKELSAAVEISRKDNADLRAEVLTELTAESTIIEKKVSNLQSSIDVTKKEFEAQVVKQGEKFQSSISQTYNNLRQETIQSATALKAELQKEALEARNLLKDLQNKYDQVKNRAWPDGSYCIFASGPCPPGFRLIEAHLRALSTYAADGRYIRPETFGSSSIRCHGNCGQWHPWNGELNLAVCCK